MSQYETPDTGPDQRERRTLLLPCAGPPAAGGNRPDWMLTAPSGDMVARLAAQTADPSSVKRLIIGITARDDARYQAADALRRAFAGSALPPLEVVVLPEPTAGPAQSVLRMIEAADVSGPIAVKDGDCFFDTIALPAGGFVAVYDLRSENRSLNISDKSFVLLSEQALVHEIAEKQVCSNLISVGLYGFSDAAVFTGAYARIARATGSHGMFLSHTISEALRSGEVVAPLETRNFVDVAAPKAWRDFCNRHQALVLDIDGVVFENHSRFFSPYWEDDDRPITANVAHLLDLQAQGAQLIFMTARPDEYRKKTLDALLALGLNVHALITGCRHGRRCLVNDFADSNPYPTAVAVNLERNSDRLARLLPHVP